MDMRRTLLASAAALATFAFSTAIANAQSALTGQVTSAEEGNMEGVVVSAKKEGSTITISVVSDAQGNFSFPASNIEAGEYRLHTRAIGFELDGPKTVTVGPQTVTVPVKLRKARNLATQMTSGEWFASFPGTPQQKAFMDRCTSCHTYERIALSTHNTEEWIQVLQ